MSKENLNIAIDLIAALLKQSSSLFGATASDHKQTCVKKIIEAARSNYVLPSFCAEMNTDAQKCIHCIVEHDPPTICLDKINEPVSEDFEIEWDTVKK